jgi:hypothetical protein
LLQIKRGGGAEMEMGEGDRDGKGVERGETEIVNKMEKET